MGIKGLVWMEWSVFCVKEKMVVGVCVTLLFPFCIGWDGVRFKIISLHSIDMIGTLGVNGRVRMNLMVDGWAVGPLCWRMKVVLVL